MYNLQKFIWEQKISESKKSLQWTKGQDRILSDENTNLRVASLSLPHHVRTQQERNLYKTGSGPSPDKTMLAPWS